MTFSTICQMASIACALLASGPLSAETTKVFAAASLTDALDEVLIACAETTGIATTGVYAGSGTAARQIAQGAPASIFISANPSWMDWLETRGLLAEGTRHDLLGNALVVVATPAALDRADEGHAHERNPLRRLSEATLAVADLQTVPAGIYARQALESGRYDMAGRRVVQASNVREALTWVARGEADFGIVYRSDALGRTDVRTAFAFKPDAHDPIRYPAAIIADYDSPNARGLLTCLSGEEASKVFRDQGFTVLSR